MRDMAVLRAAALAAPLVVFASAAAEAEGQRCIHVDVMPTARTDLSGGKSRGVQMVAWIEDTSGTFVDTAFITAQTGSFGIGNRPGRPDFNSGPNWPYGRRESVFPVWAHKKTLFGSPDVLTFPEITFQNGDESNLSHPFNESSRDTHFCRPLQPGESQWDTGSCASTVFTDKGVMSNSGEMSLYPPRQDIARQPGVDSSSVEMYNMLNPFDAVSQATPRDGELAHLSWPVPTTLPDGNYVLWVEVSREFDHNASYTEAQRPAPTGIPWSEYGQPYRGQPSVLYRVPFSITATETSAIVMDYAGYGDPDGFDGVVHAPDNTISTTVPGSGAGRLAVVSDGGQTFRVRVVATPNVSSALPGPPLDVSADVGTSNSTTIEFSPPAPTGSGPIRGYEVRYLIGSEVTEANFLDAIDAHPTITVGATNTFRLDRLLPETTYSVGIRAYDDCHNTGPVSVITFTTPQRSAGEVDACFIATAAYGSMMASDVEMLRRFRDLALKKTVLGELFVETYYTFGPPVAGVVGESELLRSTARNVLLPLVTWVRSFRIVPSH